MIYATLAVNEGMDGNFYFIANEYDYEDWRQKDGQVIYLKDAKVKVMVRARTMSQKDAGKLLYAYCKGKQNGSIGTHRLDFVYHEKPNNQRSIRRYVEEAN